MKPIRVYTSMSKWQLPMMRDFAALAPGIFVPMSEASKLDQRTLGSLYHRYWIAYRPGKGFHATEAGRREVHEYIAGEARHRANPDRPLSHYFEPSIYGVHERAVKREHNNLRVMAS
jgi:hypothetical protein